MLCILEEIECHVYLICVCLDTGFALQFCSHLMSPTLNRHMLLHAAEQLRKAAMVTPQQPIPKYAQAAHLVDATRLLLGHFDGYMSSVPKMRQVSLLDWIMCCIF